MKDTMYICLLIACAVTCFLGGRYYQLQIDEQASLDAFKRGEAYVCSKIKRLNYNLSTIYCQGVEY